MQSKSQGCDQNPKVSKLCWPKAKYITETPHVADNIYLFLSNNKFGYIVAIIKHYTKKLITKMS